MNIQNSIKWSDQRHPADLIEPAEQVDIYTLAAETVSQVFSWVADGRTLEERGFRATVAIASVRPDLFGGSSLEKLGEAAGRSKQAVWHLQDEFKLIIGLEGR